MIHRDIKPGNIIIRPDGAFSLVDFGTVRDGLRPEGGSTVVGTFGYMAPEQFQGRAFPATDVYSVGALILALISGRSPETLPHQGLAIDVQASVGGAVPPIWVDALRRMVTIDPDARPSSLKPILAMISQDSAAAETETTSQSTQPAYDETGGSREPDASFTVMVGSGLGIIPLVLLTVARLALWFSLGVVVPTVRFALAPLFGQGLKRAAQRASQAGRIARTHLANLSRHIQRAEPFVLQGRHYRRQGYASGGWREARKAWRSDAKDWRRRVRIKEATQGRRPEHRKAGSIFSDAESSPRDGIPPKKESGSQ